MGSAGAFARFDARRSSRRPARRRGSMLQRRQRGDHDRQRGDIEKSAKHVRPACRGRQRCTRDLVRRPWRTQLGPVCQQCQGQEQDFAKAVGFSGIVRSRRLWTPPRPFNDKAAMPAACARCADRTCIRAEEALLAGHRSRHRDLLHLQPQHAGPGVWVTILVAVFLSLAITRSIRQAQHAGLCESPTHR